MNKFISRVRDLVFLLALLTGAPAIHAQCTGPLGDCDGDGVADSIDQDDDNDGILDINETNTNCIIYDQSGNITGVSAGNFGQNAGPTDISASFGLPAGSIIRTVTGANTRPSGYAPPGQLYVNQNRQTTFTITGTVPVIIGARYELAFDPLVRKSVISGDGVPYALSPSTPITNGFLVAGSSGSEYYVENTANGNRNNATELWFYSQGPATSITLTTNTSTFEDIALRICPIPDSDTDSIPDYVDTDSDNDGCSDALEANGGHTTADVDGNGRLTATVDANGVPGGTSQSPISSYSDPLYMSDACFQVSSLVPFPCSESGELFQADTSGTAPTEMYRVNLVTGGSTLQCSIADYGLNAVGFNELDGYFYGISGLGGLVRIGQNCEVEAMKLPCAFGSNTGDINENGEYYILDNATHAPDRWVWKIDLNANPITCTHESTFSSFSPTFFDWAFNPVNGRLYSIRFNSSINRYELFRYNPNNQSLVNLGEATGAGINGDPGPMGAVYFDANGSFYTSNNNTGVIYRFTDVASLTAGAGATAQAFSDGPVSSSNDGARCASAPITIDFGDAPASYGTLLADDGPRHNVGAVASIRLGSVFTDGELDAFSGATATGDDSDSTADEDLPVSLKTICTSFAGSDITWKLPVTNTSGNTAKLYMWIDFNQNGSFDAAELDTALVPNGADSVDITFSVPPGITAGNYYSRFRITTYNIMNLPTGAASNGEVEDHLITVINCMPDISVIKSVDTVLDLDGNGIDEGDQIVYSFTVTNTGNMDLTGVTISDTLITITEGPIDLPVGAIDDTTFTGTYTITATDIANGSVENSASASGTPVDGNGDPVDVDGDGNNMNDGVTSASDAGTAPDGTPITNPNATETDNPMDIYPNDPGDPTDDPTTFNFPVPLPLDLLRFEVRAEAGLSELLWETAKEKGLARFEIEHSTDGSKYKSKGKVEAKGTVIAGPATYHFTDTHPVQGVNYYRLAMVDVDGTVRYSPVRHVIFGVQPGSIGLYPNPVPQGAVVNIAGKDIKQVKVYTRDGRLVQVLRANSNPVLLNTGKLSPGQYIVIVDGVTTYRLTVTGR